MLQQEANNMIDNRNQRGFALPTVMLIAVILTILGLTLVQSVSSIRTSLDDQYYNRLAKESAEAGIVAANYCLMNNSFIQTWGPAASKPNLTQNTTCTGATRNPAVTSLQTGSNIRTTFTIGDLETRDDGAIIVAVTGRAEVLRGTSNTVARTYTTTLKQLVNWNQFKASQSASGTSRTCSIVSNELYCWGLNTYGQLGNSTNIDSFDKAVKVTQETGMLAGKVVENMFAAQYHNCALAAGKVYCWGYNNAGQLGNGTTVNSNKPVLVGGALSDKIVTAIGGTGDISCAIAEGKIYCWGENSRGTVGNNDPSGTDVSTPTLVSTINLGAGYTATKLSTSGSRSQNMCAIVDGKAWCWGGNEAGQIGNGVTGGIVRAPTKVVDTGVLAGKTVTSISQDGYPTGLNPAPDQIYPHVCAVADSQVFCWGENEAGQLGVGNTNDSNTPVAVLGVLNNKVIQDVNVGIRHSCALANSRIYCWGSNNYGQLGDGQAMTATTRRTTPDLIAEDAGVLQGKTITAIGGGANRGCAIADFRSYCWGLGTDGQIGDGYRITRNRPTEATFLRPQVPSFIF